MSFINPALLWALPLAVVPIIIHLLFRWRHRPVVFGDLALLRDVAARVMPRRLLREWLLTAVRCALVALLVLCFARPVLHWGHGAPASEQETLDVVVLLDASISMGERTQGRTRFERAKTLAVSLLSALRPQDRASVVLFSDRVEAASGELQAGAERLLPWLGRAGQGRHGTDYRLALESAYSLLTRSQAGRKAVVLLSDNAAHGFRTLDPKAVGALSFYDPKVRLAGVSWDDEPANISLEGAEFREGSLRVRASLYGRSIQESDLALWADGRMQSKRRVRLKAGPNEFAFAVLPSTGVFTGRIESRRDALEADDVFHFAFAIEEAPRVLVLESRSRNLPEFSGSYFLKSAFQSERLPYRASFLDPADLAGVSLEGFRAVVVLSPASLRDNDVARIERYVREGGGLWVFPEEDPEGFRRLAPILPARFKDVEGRSQGLRPDSAPVPPGSGFAWSDFELDKVEFKRAFTLEPREGSKVWFRTGRGTPALVAGRLGRGSLLVWSTPLRVGWTNLPLKPAFTSWLHAALGWMAVLPDSGQKRLLNLEEIFVRTWNPPETPPVRVTLLPPDRTVQRFSVTERRFQFPRTEDSGLYRILYEGPDGRREDAFAVNIDPALREGDLRRETHLPWAPLREPDFSRDFMRLLFGEEARNYALALVFLLFAAETLLAKTSAKESPGKLTVKES